MKDFSNRYIFLFSAAMVIIVATLLSLAATLLQPIQEKNLEIEKKRSMLESVRIAADKKNAETLYDKYIRESFVLNAAGETVSGVDAFRVVLRNEQKKPLEKQNLPVFTANLDNGQQAYIIPVEGKGLWGPIYGYVSLESDFNTIYGVNFDHKGETPGLGAEINKPFFEGMFVGKKLYEGGKFVSVAVLKGGADPENPHGVDAISGGTITSKGLEKMLYDCLSKYDVYFVKRKQP